MFKKLLSGSYQTKMILLVTVVVIAAVVFTVAGKSELVSAEDGTQTIQRSIFGYKLNS